MKLFYILALTLSPAVSFAGEKANLQWSICDARPATVLRKLGHAGEEESKSHEITYYDAKPAAYLQQGISFRIKGKEKAPESCVKVRFDEVQSGMPDDVDCSWESYGSRRTYTCEYVEDDGVEFADPWSHQQMRFVNTFHAVDWSSLAAFGPYPNPKWELKVAGYDATFDSVDADSLHFMELAVKVPLREEDDARDAVTEALTRKGVQLCPVQEGKTDRLFRALGNLPKSVR